MARTALIVKDKETEILHQEDQSVLVVRNHGHMRFYHAVSVFAKADNDLPALRNPVGENK